MVLADGIIDARELETLYKIGIEQYGLSQSEITETIKNAGSSFIIPEKLEDKVRFLYNLAQIAWADKKIDPSERDLLERYALRMGFEAENIKGICEFLLEEAQKDTPASHLINLII